MIGKIINKDFFALLFVSMLTILAVVYGLTTIPNPATQRATKFDHQRVSDLGKLKQSIQTYYYDKKVLPQTLTVLEDENKTYYDTLNILDPDSGTPYEYLVSNETNYQLCANFATDSTTEDQYTYDSENYNYSLYNKDFEHPQGRKCFVFSVTPSYQYQGYTEPVNNTIIDLSRPSSESAE